MLRSAMPSKPQLAGQSNVEPSKPRIARNSRLSMILIAILSATAVVYFISFVTVRLMVAHAETVEPHRLFEVIAKAVVEAGTEVARLQRSSTVEVVGVGEYPDSKPELHTRGDLRSSEILAKIRKHIPISIVDEEDSDASKLLPTYRRRSALSDGASKSAAASQLRREALPLGELNLYIDPLDATQEYSEGLTEYVSISACVTRCGVPVMGFIYLPFSERLYWTRPGTGVHVNFDVETAVMAERSILGSWPDTVDGSNPTVCCDERVNGRLRPAPVIDGSVASGNAPSRSDGGASAPALLQNPLPQAGSTLRRSLPLKGRAAVPRTADEQQKYNAQAHGRSLLMEDSSTSVPRDGLLHSAADVWSRGIRVVGSRSHGGNHSLGRDTITGLASSFAPSGDTIPPKPTFIKAGGAGYKLIELVEGRADAYFHDSKIRKWDLCAGDALLRSMGGKLTDIAGKPVDYCVYGPDSELGYGPGRPGGAGPGHLLHARMKASVESEGAPRQSKQQMSQHVEWYDATQAAELQAKRLKDQFLVHGVVATGNPDLHADLMSGIRAFSMAED